MKVVQGGWESKCVLEAQVVAGSVLGSKQEFKVDGDDDAKPPAPKPGDGDDPDDDDEEHKPDDDDGHKPLPKPKNATQSEPRPKNGPQPVSPAADGGRQPPPERMLRGRN
jgi:hypothetical protein